MSFGNVFTCFSLLVLVLDVNVLYKCNAKVIGPAREPAKEGPDDLHYMVGVARADVTGPAAEVNMMGYADLWQNSAGIHTRQYSRAFIIRVADQKPIVFVNIDTAMTSQAVTSQVMVRLKEKFGDLYSEQNVCLSSTHTHSVPGGFLQYLVYVFTAFGFKKDSYEALVNGIVVSIERAHENMQPANIYFQQGELLNANINRSPTSYLRNPLDERQRYKYDVDKEMFLLKFTDADNKPFGMLNWFPVHCTSMNKSNHLISSDNKGLAALMFEQYMDPSSIYGNSSFVAGFAQANEGDVSPNIHGARCQNSGKKCDAKTSYCDNGDTCVASGPGKNMFESTKIIGRRQFEKAKDLFATNGTMLTGPIAFGQQYVNMSNQTVASKYNTHAKTCLPAMGYSFGAGTTDGAGVSVFYQGMTTHDTVLELVAGWLMEKPSEDQQTCQQPKPILLNTGQTTEPYPWQPEIVSIQILKIGSLIIAAVPGEFTTMSGRRLKSSILKAASDVNSADEKESTVVIAGLSNTYSSYITTYEEYQAQRYEAASTIFGPHTLEAYQELYQHLYRNIIKEEPIHNEVEPPNFVNISMEYSMRLDDIDYDEPPKDHKFGDMLKDADLIYSSGSIVNVVFASANPNNNNMIEKSFLDVEQLDIIKNMWQVIAKDSDWQTRFYWARDCGLRCSTATMEWHIPEDIEPGRYRIRHYGYSKNKSGNVSLYSGTSSPFTVAKKNSLLALFKHFGRRGNL